MAWNRALYTDDCRQRNHFTGYVGCEQRFQYSPILVHGTITS